MSHNITYVCIVCSATFTRKYSAIRHCAHIHAGTAFFVRLIDYIVGRAQGLYQSSDPLSYRRRRNTDKNFRNLHSLANRNPSASNKIPASQFTVRSNETKKHEYYGINSTNESIESDLPKFQELATLVRKHHSVEVANQILSRIKRLYLGGKDNVIEIDKKLEVYRDIDRNRRI